MDLLEGKPEIGVIEVISRFKMIFRHPHYVSCFIDFLCVLKWIYTRLPFEGIFL